MRVHVHEPQPDHRHLICEALRRAFDDLELSQAGSGLPVDLEVTAIDRSRSAVRRTDTGEVVFLEKEKGGRFFEELIAAVRRFRPTAARRRSENASTQPPEPKAATTEHGAAIAWLGRRMVSSTRELLELTRWQRALLQNSSGGVLIDQQLRAIERLQGYVADLQVLVEAKPDFSHTLQPLVSWIQLRASIWRRLATPNLTVEAHPDHHAILIRADRHGLLELLDSLVHGAAAASETPAPLRIVVTRVWDQLAARVRVEVRGAGTRAFSLQARTRAAVLTEALGGRLIIESQPPVIEFEISDEQGLARRDDHATRTNACIMVLGDPGQLGEVLVGVLERQGIGCLVLTGFESAVSLTRAGCRYPLLLINSDLLSREQLPIVARWNAEGLNIVVSPSRQPASELSRDQVEEWFRAGVSALIEEPFPIQALSFLARLDSYQARESPLSR
jgi:hypothetical protein